MRDKAFSEFNALKIGQAINIKKFAQRDPVAFKNYAIEYIDLYGALEFSNDYSIVTKCESFSQIAQRTRISVILTYGRQ